MTSDPSLTCSFELSTEEVLAPAALLEAIAMYTGGQVQHGAAHNRFARYRVTASSHGRGSIDVEWATQGDAQDSSQRAALHYCLLVGLHQSNITVQYRGPMADWLPSGGRLERAAQEPVRFVNPFQDHLPPKKRAKPLPPELLAEIFEAIKTAPDIQSLIATGAFTRQFEKGQTLRTWELLNHRSGVHLQVALADEGKIDSHSILGYTPSLATAEQPRISQQITPFRTWGEAFVAHDDARTTLLSNLTILPNEVAFFTDRLYRCSIEDRRTLQRPKALTFGKGASKVFSAREFLSFAQRYLQAKNAKLATACITQAKKLRPTAEEQTLLAALQKRIELAKKPVERQKSRPLCELAQILDQEGYAEIMRVEQARQDAYEMSDFGRYRIDVIGVPKVETTDLELLERGFSKSALATFFDSDNPIGLAEMKMTLLQIIVSGKPVWATERSGRYLIEGHFDSTFGGDPL